MSKIRKQINNKVKKELKERTSEDIKFDEAYIKNFKNFKNKNKVIKVNICPHCGHLLYPDRTKNKYVWECPVCDESFYDFEAKKVSVIVPKHSCLFDKRLAIFDCLKTKNLIKCEENYIFQDLEEILNSSYKDKVSVIGLCDFDIQKIKGKLVLKDRQGGNLGNIESNQFRNINEVIERLADTYFYENGYRILPG